MFGFFGGVLATVVAIGGGLFMFSAARQFVRSKLRFVDGVHNPVVPWAAAAVVFVVSLPVVALLPVIGVGTGAAVALATGMGTASGVKALKRGE